MRLLSCLSFALLCCGLSGCSGAGPLVKEDAYPHISSQIDYDTPYGQWHARRYGVSPYRHPSGYYYYPTQQPMPQSAPTTSPTEQPTFMSINNQGVFPERERWFVNNAMVRTPVGDRVRWYIDTYEYQFRADSDIAQDPHSLRTCRRGSLMRRTSQFAPWEYQTGYFCRTYEGNWVFDGA